MGGGGGGGGKWGKNLVKAVSCKFYTKTREKVEVYQNLLARIVVDNAIG